jgi:hypothetical protein
MEQKKICRNCKTEKQLDEFHTHPHGKDGHINVCKECVKLKRKKYYSENALKFRQYSKEYRKNNKEKNKKQHDNWKKLNPNYYKNYHKKQRDKNREKIRKYQNEYFLKRTRNDLNFKLAVNIRKRLGRSIKDKWKSGSSIKDLGCSIEELKIYLEKQFKPGMTWNNWKRDGWHIDHIIPLSTFDLTDPKQFKKAVHYTNLQPLWWYENLSKNNKSFELEDVQENNTQKEGN